MFGLAPAEALTLEFFHPGSNGGEIVGSAHRDFLPSVYGANARYRVWFRRLGRDLALQNCRSRVSQPEIYHSLHGRVWARLRVCQRRWELWSPLLSVFAGRGRTRDALTPSGVPPSSFLLRHRISRPGAKSGHLPGQCPVAAWAGNRPLYRAAARLRVSRHALCDFFKPIPISF